MSLNLGIDRHGGLWIECRGAPRDLGLDQGLACAAAIRERVRHVGRVGWLGRFRPADPALHARARATARAVRRHFPHLDEWLDGIARGARVPAAALAQLLAEEPASAGCVSRAGVDAAGRLRVALPEAGVLRRVRPEAGFATAEWTLPWLPGALAGVNAAGLAGAALARGGRVAPDGCAAPAQLLLQNCLWQFETVENALEWCERRPAGGRCELLFVDARGGRGAVSLDGEKRARSEAPAAGAEPMRRPLLLDPARRRLEADEDGRTARVVAEAAPA